ncbi:hypothetical protein O3Q51_05945 [Cryomorphaceae bacterium 1068]|nr:hypothetical protein [Cryomorphaceae bacterium 1068]
MKRRHLYTFVVALILQAVCVGQDTLFLDKGFYEELSISIGYDYSFAEPNSRNYHLIEARIQKQRYGGHHGHFGNLSAGLMVGINTDKFLVSPVVGGQFSYGPFFTGIDMAYFTDFEEGTFRIIPMIGFGSYRFRISINPHIRITNRDYEPIDRGNLTFSMRLFTIKKEKE